MKSHGLNPGHPESLPFYCRECDLVFDSVPDGSGYEQVECPNCNEICMTVAFEQEEQERRHNEATFFSLLGSVTGLFNLQVPRRQQARDASETVTIVRYEDRLYAEQDADMLVRRGIEATLELNDVGSSSWFGGTNSPCIELKVLSHEVTRAKAILHETDPPLPQKEKRRSPIQDITFDCEECGEMITFSGQRRGRVETCPHCFQYVDVPDD